MNTADFELFIKLNFLKKIEVAEYLEVSPSYISKILKGESMSADKLKRLLEHPTWNTAPLLGRAQDMQPKYTHPCNLPPIHLKGDVLDIRAMKEARDEAAEPIEGEDIEEVEAVEIPIAPTAVVREPDIRLSKWVDKFADDAERLRFGEILQNATLAREVKEPDMAPALKIGQYICLELLPHDTPIKNGKIYFIDHNKLGGFFRRLYEQEGNIVCRADNPLYEEFFIDKEHIYDLYRIVGVFSTDVIEDPRDEQIDRFMAQTGHLLQQHDAHNANTAKLIEQQGVLIEMLKNK